MLSRLKTRLIWFFQRSHAEKELEAELLDHLEQQTEQNISLGMDKEEALYAARKAFGGVEQAKEQTRDIRGLRWLEDIWKDLRYGARILWKKPGFTLIVVSTLAIGLGVNTAIFTIFDAFILKPLPLKDPGSLVKLEGRLRTGKMTRLFSYLEYLEYRDRNQVFDGLIAWNQVAGVFGEKPVAPINDVLHVSKDFELIIGKIVSGNYFSVLGAEMALGRGFLPEEDRMPGASPVMVLSYDFWRRRFNSDPNLIGKTIKLSGQSYTVVGVTSREFIGTEPNTPQFWIPLMMRDQAIQAGDWHHIRWLTDRNADAFVLTGRLKHGISLEQALAETNVIAAQIAQTYPAPNRKTHVELKSSATLIELNGEFLPLILPLTVAVGLILLMTCANVANLLLARAATRGQEMAVRLALGASRGRVIRQLLTESALLAALGGGAGLLLSIWTLNTLTPIVISRLPMPRALIESFALNLNPDYRIFGFSLLASIVAGVAAGLAPALQASKPNLTYALKDEGSAFGVGLSQSGLRNSLVVVQVAVCLTLLIAAGLLVRNLQKVRTIDTGLETANVFTISTGITTTPQEPGREAILRRQLAERLRGLPGVKAVSLAERQPVTGNARSTPISLPGQPSPPDQSLRAKINRVSPEYFETLGIRLLRGRLYSEQEVLVKSHVIVISESTARRFWPNEDAIGKQIGVAVEPTVSADSSEASHSAPLPQFEVIGVARDARSGWIWMKDETYLYAPLPHQPLQTDGGKEYILVRTEGDPGRAMAGVRGEAVAVHPNFSVSLRRVSDSLAIQLAPFEALAQVAGSLGMLALLLASVGLYGVMSFTVHQRTREIGVRVALGAQTTDILHLILKEAMKLTFKGILIGLLGAVAISRLLAAVLIDLSPFDPIAFGGVALFLFVIALSASYLPTRRATKLNPVEALRDH
jgi:macrolide transport system ATP-binding/permease protein